MTFDILKENFDIMKENLEVSRLLTPQGRGSLGKFHIFSIGCPLECFREGDLLR